ncbi:shikimate dehydrogenase family protein [Blastopirellula marina]|uniref:Shikimate dehydrogenase substrate binding N-terminal domain-containing protein n=1 Tax=Blastopirellula marina DSM 3645 TaxID=314230 RepID=A3ZMF7_9BACT|nr:hypothetical protein [Blastopirellula marina]EAQ82130.1 hypothetical protein DSM3645_00410 [Blastopirellula marina DSM 3645]
MTHETLQEIVCSLGYPAAGNPTQYVMEKCFEAAGCDWRCLTLEVEPNDFAAALHGAKALGFLGAAIAAPFLQQAVALVDEKTPVVEIGGLANCVAIRRGKLHGENTEAAAVAAVLSDVQDKRIVIAGADGRGRAIAAQLATLKPQKMTIFAAADEPGQSLAIRLHEEYEIETTYELAEKPLPLVDVDIVIQTGDDNSALLFDLTTLTKQMTVVDLAITPRDELGQAVQEREATLHDGLTIAAHLHAINYHIWTGGEADVVMIRETLEEYLGV